MSGVDLSVVIPTFRRPLQLAEAIGSALAQADVTVEVIVIDDSPEGSARAVIEIINDSRIQYHHNSCPTGGIPSIVRNLGWRLAAGQFIHFLDDDDIVPPSYYRLAKYILRTNTDVGMIFGIVEPFGKCSPDQLEHERRYFATAARRAELCQHVGSKWKFIGEMLFRDALLVCSAAIVRQVIVEQLGGFDQKMPLFEDSEFYVRVMREFGVKFVPHVAIQYRIGSPSLMHSPKPDELHLSRERECRALMRAKYRTKYGLFEFCMLALRTRVFEGVWMKEIT
jgi:glycosyltransferase involved in cell wall biosynthesis